MTMRDAELTRPAGLAELKAMMAPGRRPPIADLLDFTLVDVSEGSAVFSATPTRQAYNPIGTVHGGYAATLLDSACGCAVQSRLAGDRVYTTLELKVSYHKAITDRTGPMRCEGRVVTLGRRVAFAEATLKDEAGRLYATASSSLLVMDRAV